MSVKGVVKALSPPIALNVIHAIRRRLKRSQGVAAGLVTPWSAAYGPHRAQFIAAALADNDLLEDFRTDAPLPAGYGYGLDERCVEYPWLISRLPVGTRRILDAGSVLNHAYVLENGRFDDAELQILTLAPEENCFWYKGISYLYGDLRSIQTRDDYYDAVVCLSTLEHVGADNTIYTACRKSFETEEGDDQVVMSEFRRILKPGGSIFLSVPFGAHRDFVNFQQYDSALLERAITAFGKIDALTKTFYRYDCSGWSLSTEADCATAEYVAWIAEAWNTGKMPNIVPTEPDLAAAARAVACVHLVKARSKSNNGGAGAQKGVCTRV